MKNGWFIGDISVVGPREPDPWIGGTLGNDGPMVMIDGGDSGYYWIGFESREEVDAYIARLAKARDEAFP